VCAVIDANVFVPAIAYTEPECAFYNSALRKCWKIVISDEIRKEYGRVIANYGYRPDVVIHELNKLYAMNKYRESKSDSAAIGDDLAPRKDRHIVAPCLAQDANVIVTHDRGIHERKNTILSVTGANVLRVNEAQILLDGSEDCH
jgi:predicted nucleic acid-binding protein